MLRPGGYASIRSKDTGEVIREFDTFTCAHGNEIVRVRPGSVDHAPRCNKCGGRICLKCQAEMNRTLQCVPFEEWLLATEARGKEVERADRIECAHSKAHVVLAAGAPTCPVCHKTVCMACFMETIHTRTCEPLEARLAQRQGQDRLAEDVLRP